MRILFVADAHSPIALNWIGHFVETGHEVHWVTTYPATPPLALASLRAIPVAFTGAASEGGRAFPMDGEARLASLRGAQALRMRVFLRHWLGPLTVRSAARRLREAIDSIRPDLVHALRIPFEGMLAASARASMPLLLSVWGNDFTFHAPAAPGMAVLTRRALARADGLHADCRRDLGLAAGWGYPSGRPAIVLPGNGGVRTEIFHPRAVAGELDRGSLAQTLAAIPPDAPVVIYPRGFRAYVRLDTFFRMIPAVLAEYPEARFLCPAMAGDPVALRWIRRMRVEAAVHLLPRLTPPEMAAAFARAQVATSPSLHDGTPNTLLEAMACGCVPVAGDIESVREWITDGVNGLLIDPTDPADLATAVNRLLRDDGLRAMAAAHNLRQIQERARYEDVMARAESFYQDLVR